MHRTKTSAGIAALIAVLVAAAAPAGAIDIVDPFGKPVNVATYVSLTSVPQGGTAQVAVKIEIEHPWHVNANELTDEFLVPTEIEFNPPEGVKVIAVVYPEAVEKKLGFSDSPLQLFEGTVYVGAVIEVTPEFEPGEAVIRAVLTYQACDDSKCLLPETVKLRIPFTVSTRRQAIDAAHPQVFSQIDFGAAGVTTAGRDHGTGLGGTIAARGMFVAFLLVFIGGLALNLTPCVYPIIPITVSYFGGQASGSKASTIVLAILYLLGMAAMYSTLGVFAALTGSILGSALQNPIVTAFIALVMVALAASMFGFYEIRVPAKLSGVAGTAKQGYLGAFFMGLTVGIVAAPCIGPFVLGLLTFVGERGDPLLGFALFFTLSAGLGVPYVFLAVASGNISKLPRSGEWMEWIRRVFGVILLAMAVYFLDPVLPDTACHEGSVDLHLFQCPPPRRRGADAAGGTLVRFRPRTHTGSRPWNTLDPIRRRPPGRGKVEGAARGNRLFGGVVHSLRGTGSRNV
jgi:thiol:disulfide interchange protein DsbD